MFVTILDKKPLWRGARRRGHLPLSEPHLPGPFGIETQTNFVKRVRGVPGDVVERKNNVTYINGEAIDPDNEIARSSTTPMAIPTITAPTRWARTSTSVVGDNVYNSHDSRTWMDEHISEEDVVGPLTEDMIVGKVRYVIWPLDEIGAVE